LQKIWDFKGQFAVNSAFQTRLEQF